MSHRFDDIFHNLPRETQELIESRYGKRARPLWKHLALALLVIGLPWLMWSAWYHSNPAVRVTLISFTPIDERSIDITFAITRDDPSKSQECTLIARDFELNIVGEIDVVVPPSDGAMTQVKASIPTRLAAVNAAVLECRPAQ